MTVAGDLDRRIAVERNTPGAADGFGHRAEGWATFATVWARYAPVSDGEKVAAGQRESALMARFTIRSSVAARTIDAKDRVAFGGRTFNILGVKETAEGRNRYIEITAVARSDA